MIEIRPLDHCDAAVVIPGSKSYTHRTLIVSALAEGESILINALRSEDTNHTIHGLKKFGVRIYWKGDRLHVQGKGGKLAASEERLFVGNSGTSMRFLTALAALKNGRTLLDGSERMRGRPIEDLLGGLRALGIRSYSKEGNGCPPVVVESQGLKGGTTKIRGEESSQFLSALLMVAPYASRDVTVELMGNLASKPYVDITRQVISAFGVEVQGEGYHSFFVRSGQRYLPQVYRIEGDASHASYFLSAAAITRGKVRVENLNSTSIQGDTGFVNILEKMGCNVIRGDSWAEVHGKELQRIEVDMNAMPDLVPTLAVTAAFARGMTVIRNIGHLRLKESDRIRALARELRKMGIQVEEGKDWLKIEGGKTHGAEIETYNDHRLAMSFAIAGLVTPGVKIKGEECVNKSFPDFWKTFERLYT
ncbi:MAG: 3-phosphoshikimate 1-carboxyvinyltransferase [Deltaproteobacteria bacterium]|nr:3-phosphoshikimate 1-carboxyvinyltransferase [Deltaproteobacteria bacterium]MBM4323741.1 3-phosphoshikimate 1-carboxyvinyltransferase [Deltaproteobacteria bacterium]